MYAYNPSALTICVKFAKEAAARSKTNVLDEEFAKSNTAV